MLVLCYGYILDCVLDCLVHLFVCQQQKVEISPHFSISLSGAPFGHAPGKVDETAKQVIFPTITQSSDASDAIYKKSHGTLAVAEQRSRGYDWDKKNIKPDSYVFGSKPQNIAFNGVSKSIADVLTTTEEDRGPVVSLRAVSEFASLQLPPLKFCRCICLYVYVTRYSVVLSCPIMTLVS